MGGLTQLGGEVLLNEWQVSNHLRLAGFRQTMLFTREVNMPTRRDLEHYSADFKR